MKKTIFILDVVVLHEILPREGESVVDCLLMRKLELLHGMIQ